MGWDGMGCVPGVGGKCFWWWFLAVVVRAGLGWASSSGGGGGGSQWWNQNVEQVLPIPRRLAGRLCRL